MIHKTIKSGYAVFRCSGPVIILRSDIPPIPAITVNGINIELINVNLVTLLLLFILRNVLYADMSESFFSVKTFIVLTIFASFVLRLLKYIVRCFSWNLLTWDIRSSIISSCERKLCLINILFKSSLINSSTVSSHLFPISV